MFRLGGLLTVGRSDKLQVPSEDRELLLDPPPHMWEERIERNRLLAESWEFEVGGLSAAELRSAARRELLDVAASRTNPGVTGESASQGGWPTTGTRRDGAPPHPSAPSDALAAPIVLTGHQPLLYHPGVWVKAFLAERLAKRLGGRAFNAVVDSDSEEEIAIDLPSLATTGRRGLNRGADVPTEPSAPDATHFREGSLVRRREVLASIPRRLPFEAVPKPTAAQFDGFCHRALRHLATLVRSDAPLRHFERFRRSGLAVLPLAENLADFLTLARRHYEASYNRDRGPSDGAIRDVPISALSRGRSFRRFFLDIVWQAECFAGIYNEALTDYRRERNIRSVLHPFPDLRVEPDEVELPFWLLGRDGRRYALTVRQTERGRMALGPLEDGGDVSDSSPSSDSDSPQWVEGPAPPPGATPEPAWWSDWEARLEGVEIRPKAVPLSIFSRIFLSDVFIHGVGGREYDRVTDEVFRRYYGVEPPAYLVASMALHLPLKSREAGLEPGGWSRGKLRDRLRRMRYNPQAFVERRAGRAGELARKKERLIREMWKPDADRRALTRGIEGTNAELFELLARDRGVGKMQAALARAKELNRDWEAATWRGYPFACYHPDAVRELLTSVVGSRRGESRLTESPPHCRM